MNMAKVFGKIVVKLIYKYFCVNYLFKFHFCKYELTLTDTLNT